MLLEREIPPEGLSSSASPASVGGLIGTDVGSYVGSVVGCTVGLPVGTGVLGDEVGAADTLGEPEGLLVGAVLIDGESVGCVLTVGENETVGPKEGFTDIVGATDTDG